MACASCASSSSLKGCTVCMRFWTIVLVVAIVMLIINSQRSV